jgi:PAS domain S-box-containing protein
MKGQGLVDGMISALGGPMPEENQPVGDNMLQPEVASLLRLAKEAIIVKKLDGTITGWNPSAERLYGYPAQEMIGQSSSRLVPLDLRDQLSLIAGRIRRGETIEDFGTRRVRKDGQTIDVSLTMAPLRDEMRQIVGVLCLASDMSERNRLDRAERDQSFLSAIISSAEDAIITKDLDGIVTSWNPGAKRMFGYTDEEMVGKPISILIPPDHLDEEPQILERLRQGQRIEHYETQRARKDGRIIDVSLTISPVKDRIGRLIAASNLTRDITDQKRFEKAERDQVFLASIVSSAQDAIISKDLQGIVTSWNQSAEKIFGYSADEMIGQPIAKLIPLNHPDEEPQILQRIRRGERIDHYDAERLRKDGQIVHVSLTISPIRDPMGRIIGASKIARDITERRQWQAAEMAQSFLGALVESADDAIISKNLDGIVTSWNPGAERLFQYTAKEMIGKPISILVPSDNPDEEPQILQRIRRGEQIAHYETKRVRKDGSVIDVALTVSPIKDRLGRILGASKIARDITESKRAEAREREILRQAQQARTEAEQSRQQAEQASTAKDEFLATISHELRTPMTSILGWSRMLAQGQVSPERQQRAFETIDRNARSQAQLIEDLLDISRITSGKLRVDFKAVEMAAVVTAAVEAVRPAAEAKRIRLDSLFSSGAGPIVGDAERLQQVVWNLLSNAIKFTPPDGRVQVELQRVESQVELRVVDTGVGINPTFLPHVFDRFSQSDSSITRSRRGLGMGLAIVKSLVELHGGVVSVSSPGEGQGAVFTVKLPISAVRHDSIVRRPVDKPALQAELKQRDDLVGLKVLIVDDDPDTCEILRAILNQCGSIVEIAQSARAALDTLDRWRPDILVSDIGMPDGDGYELIRNVREERGSRIPAVALTAMARIDDRLKALTAGYQMHVAKPVEPVELINIVSSLVGLVDRRPEP